MSSSSTSVPACPAPEEQQDQNGPAKPAEAQSRLQEHIATAEALDAQLEAASRRDSARVPVHTDSAKGIPDPERHSRKCKICRHRDRDVIEADFIEWCHPSQICEDYKISYRALYRHATATGLLERRRENVCIVVHKLLEEVEYVENPSAFAILRAVRTLASLDSRDRWAEPHTTHVVVNATEPPAESANPVTVSGPVESRSSGLATRRPPRRASAVALVSVPPCLSASGSNRHTYEKLEVPVTHTKQTSEVVSNRHKT